MTKTTSQIEFARPATDFEVMQQEHIEQLKVELAEARADVKDRDNALAAIMAVLPDSAKPCDAPDLIKHFKSQMLAYGSEYIRIEKQLTEARAEIERKDALIEQMREALKLALLYVPDNATDAVRISEAALEAAERNGCSKRRQNLTPRWRQKGASDTHEM